VSALTDLDNFDFQLDEPIAAAFWNKAEHPRGRGGLFIDKTGGGDIGEFAKRFANAIAGRKTLDAVPLRRQQHSVKQFEAVDVYRSGAFQNVNDGLRASRGNARKITGAAEGKFGNTEQLRQTVATLDEMAANSKLTTDVTLHRGVADPATVFGDHWNEDDLTGLSWTEYGYSSMTFDERLARDFAQKNGVVMNILAPQGMGAIDLTRNVGETGSEDSEITLSRGIRYRIVRDHGRDKYGTRLIDVEVTS
jgi:ADP-ribosyltransferase exoenzyme